MEKMNVIIVYIDDIDQTKRELYNAFMDDIRDDVTDFVTFEHPLEGLAFIRENIGQKIIVILDWKFTNSKQQGADILKAINDISRLVPVIVYTGQPISASDTDKMFKGRAFSFVSKDTSTQNMIDAIVNAYDSIQNDIRTVMEEWILRQDEEKRKRPYMSYNGKVYTLNEILESIRRQDDLGKETAKGILSLATELFTNNMRK